MEAHIDFNNASYVIDLGREINISIPVRFDAQQLKAFGAPPAKAAPYSGDDFTLDVNQGAGCNCPVLIFSAHLHGTHTECVGHISSQNHIVQDVAGHSGPMPAVLVTIDPAPAISNDESYDPPFEGQDKVMTRAALETALVGYSNLTDLKALIIRTLPNDESKKTRNYDEETPPFFTNEAMTYITEAGFTHLLVDAPSVDRLQDEGKLSNHHIFWDVGQGSHDVPVPSPKTITELIFVPSAVKDGIYMLDLNIGNIRSDAAPSRPVLYEMTQT